MRIILKYSIDSSVYFLDENNNINKGIINQVNVFIKKDNKSEVVYGIIEKDTNKLNLVNTCKITISKTGANMMLGRIKSRENKIKENA